MRGRPSKLTPEIQAKIVQLLAAGNFVETVCDHVGLHKDTFYEWIKRGERGWAKDKKPVNYVDFSDAVKKAIAQVEMLTVNDVRQGVFNWQSRAWWLERRHPDKWGNRQKHEHSGRVDGTVALTLQDWRKQSQANRQQATQALDDFAEDEPE